MTLYSALRSSACALHRPSIAAGNGQAFCLHCGLARMSSICLISSARTARDVGEELLQAGYSEVVQVHRAPRMVIRENYHAY